MATANSPKKSSNLQSNSEYLNDMYNNLLLEEKDIKPLYGYMKTQPDLNEKMRAMWIDWIIDVHFKFKLRADTLFLTVWWIDRYLSEKQIKRNKLQLLGVTAMLISCKYEEIYSPEVNDFAIITENSYEKGDIIKLEWEILKMWKFNVTVPTSNSFFEIITSMLEFNTMELNLGKYLIEMFLLDYRSLKYKPSEIANTVCFWITSHRKKCPIFSEEIANDFLNWYKNEKLNYKDCSRDIIYLLENLENSQWLSVKKKFMTSKYNRVGRVKRIFG